MNGRAAPSPWFVRHARWVREAAALGPVVDLACGRGRHALAAVSLGVRTVGVDRDRDALVTLLGEARRRGPPGVLTAVRADLETALGFPLRPESCGAILVFRYLHRPLAPALSSLLRPGGLLLYETFTKEQRNLGHGPTNPAFLLASGELRELFPGLEMLAYEEGLCPGERPEALARLAARRSALGPPSA
ncbi:MAG TPA: methyltransferase domain-containing protein [Myxococcota bacterium]|nr:methyltransferase domain-containing protein [Myxococcota bacterium]